MSTQPTPTPKSTQRNRNTFTVMLLMLVTVFITLSSVTVQPTAQVTSDVDTAITRLMEIYDVPGVAVAIVKDGNVTLSKGYGVRNTTSKAKVDPDTMFALGSVTKSLTALGIELLVNEGKLSLDTPIINYIPDFKLSDPEAQKTLTLRHLLSHTSGLSPQDTGTQVLVARNVTRSEYLKALETIPLLNQPGKSFSYANQNFVLAGLVIERVTGKSWEAFTQERIFTPLGMTHTGYDADDLRKSTNAASPHDLDVLKGMIPVEYTANLSAIGPAGGANASATDMANYVAFLLGNPSGLTLPNARIAELFSPVIRLSAASETATAQAATPDANPETLTTNAAYALGWFTEQYRGLNLVQHGGNVVGYSSSVTLIPEKNIGIVILTNANYANEFLDAARLRLTEITLGLPSQTDLAETINRQRGFDIAGYKERVAMARTYKVDAATFEKLVGDYTSTGGKISATANDGKMYLTVEKTGNVIELIPYAENAFLGNSFPYRGARITFLVDKNGSISVVLGDPKNGLELATRVGQGVTTKVLADTKGRYQITIPAALTTQAIGDFWVAIQPTPQLILVTAAYDVVSDDILTDFEALNRILDPNFKDKPESIKKVTVNGVEWIEYVYPAPSGQTSVNYVRREGKLNYYFGYSCAKVDLEKLKPTIDAVFQSFTLKK